MPGYTELRALGGGGFGEVVLARHDASGNPVAIKYLHPDLLSDPDQVAAFGVEARTLAGLDSPYVVRLYEYVAGPAGAAIVMELVEGVTLAKILEQHGKTAPEAALVVLFGSLLGLAAAHAKGVVHRDYKPANVVVNGQGASKLTDFGIAALAGGRPVPAGTLRYMPPEQFEGAPASPAADVYAATVTFYQCLVGQVPFDGQTADDLYEQHKSAAVPMDLVPGPLRPIIARGLAKDARHRPSDAGRLAAELRDAAVGSYGADWEESGRSHLAEAALLLLALLWPSGAAPAAQGVTIVNTPLTEPSGEPAKSVGHAGSGPHPSHPQLSAEARHIAHVRHIEHLEHLAHLRAERGAQGGDRHLGTKGRRLRLRPRLRLHPAAAVGAAAAVVAVAAVTSVALASRSGPGPGGGASAGGGPGSFSVTSSSPASGPASGGTLIVIHGTGFSSVDNVVMNSLHPLPEENPNYYKQNLHPRFTVVSDNEIDVTTTPGAAGLTYEIDFFTPKDEYFTTNFHGIPLYTYK